MVVTSLRSLGHGKAVYNLCNGEVFFHAHVPYLRRVANETFYNLDYQ